MQKRSVQIQSVMNNQLEGREAFSRTYFRRSLQRIKSHALLLSYYGAYGNNEPHRKEIGSKSTRMGGRPYSSTVGDRGRIKEVDKRRGSKEITSIEEVYVRRDVVGPHMSPTKKYP
ncbi:hypothetical protein Tco_0667349 [Tanacetum coccineum]